MFAKRRSEGCNTLSHGGMANVNTEKNVISVLSLLYTFLSQHNGLKWQQSPLLLCLNVNEARDQWLVNIQLYGGTLNFDEMYNCQWFKHVKFLK